MHYIIPLFKVYISVVLSLFHPALALIPVDSLCWCNIKLTTLVRQEQTFMQPGLLIVCQLERCWRTSAQQTVVKLFMELFLGCVLNRQSVANMLFDKCKHK